jgi:4-hydroxybenzoate polyprenyltransferase
MIQRVIGLAKASHFGPTVLVTAISFFFAQLFWWEGPSMLIAISIFTGQLVVGWSNDLIDYQDDLSHQRVKKPLVAGLITPKFLMSWLRAMVPIALFINLFGPLGLIGGGLSIFAIAWAVAYNFYFKFTILSPLPFAIAFGALPSAMALSKDYTPPLWMWLGGALLGTAAHFINVIKDMDEDRVSGIRGLPQRCGKVRSIAIAALLIALAIALLLTSDLSLQPDYEGLLTTTS